MVRLLAPLLVMLAASAVAVHLADPPSLPSARDRLRSGQVLGVGFDTSIQELSETLGPPDEIMEFSGAHWKRVGAHSLSKWEGEDGNIESILYAYASRDGRILELSGGEFIVGGDSLISMREADGGEYLASTRRSVHALLGQPDRIYREEEGLEFPIIREQYLIRDDDVSLLVDYYPEVSDDPNRTPVFGFRLGRTSVVLTGVRPVEIVR